MRRQSFKVMDGKVDLTDATLAKVKTPDRDVAREFFRDQLGYTDSRLVELFGEAPEPVALQSIAGVSA